MTVPDRQRLRTIARNLLLNGALLLVSLAFAAVAAEVAIRLVAPQQLILIRPDLWQPADTVGWLRRPNISVRMNTGEREVTVRTDRDGFRVGTEGRRDADLQILLIGDSFVEALQVEHEQSMAHLLEQELAGRLDLSVAVRNAGISGWGPNQYLLRTRSLMAHHSFALVVVAVFVGNDATVARTDYMPPREAVEHRRFRLPRGLRSSELTNALLAPLNDVLETRSHLFVALKNQLSTLRMRLGLTADYFPVEYRLDEVHSPRWNTTGEIAEDIAELAAANGAPTLFVLVPEAFQVYPERFRDYVRGFGIDSAAVDVDQPSRLLERALSERGLCVVDLLRGFRDARNAGPPLFGTVDQHFSPAGHALMISLIAPTASGLLTRSPPTACPRVTHAPDGSSF